LRAVYVEVWLAPLGAYRLLGLPMTEISEQTVDLTDLFGAAGRRAAEQLPEAVSWRKRVALLDELLLRPLDLGPRPSPRLRGHGSGWRPRLARSESVGSQMRWAGATSTSSPGSVSKSG
jgi:hypothetical protein